MQRASLALAVLFAGRPLHPQQPATHDSAASLAFVRVVYDLRIEFTQSARPPLRRQNVVVGSGSGFVITPTGLVLTSRHVVEEEPRRAELDGEPAVIETENRRIEVLLGGEALRADLVASDAESDLAALQLTASDLPCLHLGDSGALEPGHPVTVLGYPFGPEAEVARRLNPGVSPGATVTAGTFTAARADDAGTTRFLQTDAAIHPGSSGGPMLDADGYVVGVVRMKLAAEGDDSGAGFAVAVDVVKDFLDAHGLSGELPARLRPGRLDAMDWKRLAVDMPDTLADDSPARLRIVAGGPDDAVSFRAFRLATSMSLTDLEARLLGGELPGFVPGPASLVRRSEAGLRVSPKRLLGTADAMGPAGDRLRIEYAILDLGVERIAARYVGLPDAVAYNLGMLRQSLLRMEARPMLGDSPPEGAARLQFAEAPLGISGEVPVPAGWSLEPDTQSACPRLPAADAGIAASPAGDYPVVLRALRFDAVGAALERGFAECRSQVFARLDVATESSSVPVVRDGAWLLLELEAPRARFPALHPVLEAWVRHVQASR